MKHLRLIVGMAAALGTGLLFAVTPASAVDKPEEITVSPASLKLTTAPGTTSEGTFKVINTGQTELQFTVYAKPYTVQNEQYEPNYEVESPRSSIYRWVSFDRTGGLLKPGQEQEIAYTMRVPHDASPGSHYGVLFAEAVPDEASGGDQVIVRKKRVGAVVRLTVDGEHRQSGRTEQINLARWQWRSPLTADIRIINDGNVDLEAATSLTVDSIIGTRVHHEDRTGAVFPGLPRTIEHQWGGAWTAGIYRVTVTSEVLDEVTTTQRYVILAPAWAIATLTVAVLSAAMYIGYRRLR